MQNNYFIAGDWGTSNLRLYLCEYHASASSRILDTRFGPGIGEISEDFEDKLFYLAQDWLEQYGLPPILLSGMVGSNIGWKDAPYLNCPVDVDQIARGRISFIARGVDISILAGLRTNNPLQMPDVMRGEELQLLGWMRTNPTLGNDRLFALPGTHNKWTLVKEGKIALFLTAFTGELFGLLRKNSILITDDSAISFNQNAFMQGVEMVENMPEAQLVHSLFSTRSRQVVGEMPGTDSLSYLSGLITAVDVIGATRLFMQERELLKPVTVIGEPRLTDQYLLVLNHFGVTADACDPAAIAIAGFEAIYENLYT